MAHLYVCFWNRPEEALALIARGADTSIKNWDGKTVRDIALEKGLTQVAKSGGVGVGGDIIVHDVVVRGFLATVGGNP
jgi:hypothetical protein